MTWEEMSGVVRRLVQRRTKSARDTRCVVNQGAPGRLVSYSSVLCAGVTPLGRPDQRGCSPLL